MSVSEIDPTLLKTNQHNTVVKNITSVKRSIQGNHINNKVVSVTSRGNVESITELEETLRSKLVSKNNEKKLRKFKHDGAPIVLTREIFGDLNRCGSDAQGKQFRDQWSLTGS